MINKIPIVRNVFHGQSQREIKSRDNGFCEFSCNRGPVQ